MYADSSLGALQLDSTRQLASEPRAHPVIEGEASDGGNADPNGDDAEDGLSIMSMTDYEEEEARLPVRWKKLSKHACCKACIARTYLENMLLGLCNVAITCHFSWF